MGPVATNTVSPLLNPKLSHMPIPRSSFQIHLFHQYSSRTFPNHIGLSLVNSESLAHWIKDDDIPSGGQIIEVGRRICKRVWSGGERVTGWYVCFHVHLLFKFIWIINPVWTHSTASYFDRYLLEWQSPQRLPSWWTCWLLIVLTGYGIWSLNLFIYSFSMPLNSSWSCWANRCSYHCCKQVCVYLKPLTGQWSENSILICKSKHVYGDKHAIKHWTHYKECQTSLKSDTVTHKGCTSTGLIELTATKNVYHRLPTTFRIPLYILQWWETWY